MGIFRGLGSRSLSVTAMLKNVDFFGRNKYSNPRPQWGRHSYCLTNKHESLHKWCANAGRLSAKSGHHQASIASAPRVFWDTAAPYFSKYRQRVALYSAYRQRVGYTSSVAAAKLKGLVRILMYHSTHTESRTNKSPNTTKTVACTTLLALQYLKHISTLKWNKI